MTTGTGIATCRTGTVGAAPVAVMLAAANGISTWSVECGYRWNSEEGRHQFAE